MRSYVLTLCSVITLIGIAGCEKPPDPVIGTPISHQAPVISEREDRQLVVDLPTELRQLYKNFPSPDPRTRGEGSCVQCSIGMCGIDQNVPQAATLLWDTEYGPAELGGSYPSRVAAYAKQRGIRVYNVTGSGTIDWMRWAASTGRGAAIAYDTAHFQTLMGYDANSRTWYVCDNNHPDRVDQYTDQQFRRLHSVTGQWIVILDYPPHPARPSYRNWWVATSDSQ